MKEPLEAPTIAYPLRLPEYSQIPREVFVFDLHGHRPVYPSKSKLRGEVTEDLEVPRAHLGELASYPNLAVREVFVSSPVIESDPDSFRLADEHASRIEDHLIANDVNPYRYKEEPDSVRGTYVVNNGPTATALTERWYDGPKMAGLRLWRDKLVPTTFALDLLHDPRGGDIITDPQNGSTESLSDEAAVILRHGRDAEGIRARSIVMQHVVERHLEGAVRRGQVVDFLSLASGTAGSAIAAAKSIERKSAAKVRLSVVDRDRLALEQVQQTANDQGFKHLNEPLYGNILNKDTVRSLAVDNSGDLKQFDVVEAMGFLEYVPEPGDVFHAQHFNGRPDRIHTASEFLAEAYGLVKPGGILVVGNMNINRPHLNYLLNVVAWPYIKPRSEAQLVEMLDRTGIMDQGGVSVELSRVQNADFECNIYNILAIQKAS